MSPSTITVALWGFFIGFAGLSLLAAAGAQRRALPRLVSTLGVNVVKLENLAMLQAQHGKAASNKALPICAVRLKRLKGTHVALGRLGSDGFLVIQPHSHERRLHHLARRIHAELGRTAALNTALHVARLEVLSMLRIPTVAIGTMAVDDPAVSGSQAVQTAQMTAQTAMHYTSRMAWLDPARHEVAELRVADAVAASTAQRAHVAAQRPSKSILNNFKAALNLQNSRKLI